MSLIWGGSDGDERQYAAGEARQRGHDVGDFDRIDSGGIRWLATCVDCGARVEITPGGCVSGSATRNLCDRVAADVGTR